MPPKENATAYIDSSRLTAALRPLETEREAAEADRAGIHRPQPPDGGGEPAAVPGLQRGLDTAQGRGHTRDTGINGNRIVLEHRAARERAGKSAGIEVSQETPVGEAVEPCGAGVGVGYRPADVVM